MSSQIPGWPEAMRVMSRNPPAASRSSAACSSARSLASPISVAAVRCGTWLITATTWSWRSAGRATTSAPSSATIAAVVAKVVSAVLGAGVSTHTAPTNISGSAPSSPSSSLPAIGCPPTNRASSIDPTMPPFTLPTSVTMPVGLRQRPLDLVGEGQHRRGDERDLGIGVEPDRVDDPALEGPLGHHRVEIVAADVPAALAQGDGDASRRSGRAR